MRCPLPLLLVPLLASGCTRYDLLVDARYQQESFTNDVDILFVTDNSDSMNQPEGGENKALADNFGRFMSSLIEAEQTEASMPHQTLGDAVAVSLYYAANFTRFIDYQVGMTTTDPLFRGALVQDTVLGRDTPEIEAAFQDLVNWVISHVGGGDEQGLTALRLSICSGLSEEQVEAINGRGLVVDCADLTAEDAGASAPLYREGAVLAAIIVSDEGDHSIPDQDAEVTVEDYLDFFDALGMRVVVSVIGPTQPDEDGEGVRCNPASSTYKSIERYRDLVEATGGLLVPICDPDDPASPNPDFATALEDIGALISRLQNRFPLAAIPDLASLLVMVDGRLVPADPVNGWVYIDTGTSRYIEFRGAAIPFYDAQVQIYYRPLGADSPRDLPF